jgi:hypothetical protein
VTRGDEQLSLSHVRLRDGAAGVAGFSGRLSSLDVLGTAATVQGSIRPQVIGWYVLAALAAIAALAVIEQAIARQAASERADHHPLAVLGQIAAVVCWQATAMGLTGIAIGTPIGVAAGKVLWRVFATNLGVVPVAVSDPLLLAALVTGVLAAANVLAAVAAMLAARSHPGQLLKAE